MNKIKDLKRQAQQTRDMIGYCERVLIEPRRGHVKKLKARLKGLEKEIEELSSPDQPDG
jgi:predicted HicB family RNase H-like nuclease